MYYIIQTNYTGPNKDSNKYIDADKIEIRTYPAKTNMTHQLRINGWCGTTNDWSVFAHGRYATLDKARAAVFDIFGDVRDKDSNGYTFESDHRDGIIETYKPGKYEPMSSQATSDWCYDGIQADINENTTKGQIAELVEQYEDLANSEGYTLHSNLEYFMWEYKNECRE